VFEAIKGVAAFAALVGVIDLMHRDVRHLAADLIGRFSLNPESRFPSMLLHYADLLPGADVRVMVSIAVLYITVRLAEAYGLWNDRSWGAWLGALSGGLYLPYEFAHLIHRPSAISVGVLTANAAVVAFLAIHLWRKRKMETA
jgi:uncharacterized membrane protein (DUF2068 family)